MLNRIIRQILNSLQIQGVLISILILMIGLRSYWDDERLVIPHVLEFNMYVHSISANDGTDLPDIKLSNSENTYFLDKEAISRSALGYIHLSDRWEFYPPLYDAYFCDSEISKKLGYDLSLPLVLEINYIKNYTEQVSFKHKLSC